MLFFAHCRRLPVLALAGGLCYDDRSIFKWRIRVMAESKVKTSSKFKTADIILVGMFAAVLGILSQIQVPSPTGVPMTMQTFGVALMGVFLGRKKGLLSMLIYVLLGCVGVPVFAGLSGGPQALVSFSGGFIWGFFVLTLCCAMGETRKNYGFKMALGILGIAACHILGILQFMVLTSSGFTEAFLLVSAPYLIKDVLSVLLAYIVGGILRKRLMKAGLLN